MMVLFFGSALVNAESQWLTSKEIHVSLSGLNDTSKKSLLVEDLEEEEEEDKLPLLSDLKHLFSYFFNVKYMNVRFLVGI